MKSLISTTVPLAFVAVAALLGGCAGAEPIEVDEALEVPAELESEQMEALTANKQWNIVGGGIKVYGYVQVNSGGTWIDVCDMKADNVGVYVEFYVSRPGQSAEYRTLSDGNGSAGGCGDYVTPAGRYIIAINGHSHDGWSTGWKYLP